MDPGCLAIPGRWILDSITFDGLQFALDLDQEDITIQDATSLSKSNHPPQGMPVGYVAIDGPGVPSHQPLKLLVECWVFGAGLERERGNEVQVLANRPASHAVVSPKFPGSLDDSSPLRGVEDLVGCFDVSSRVAPLGARLCRDVPAKHAGKSLTNCLDLLNHGYFLG
jgi:hypothetical protein